MTSISSVQCVMAPAPITDTPPLERSSVRPVGIVVEQDTFIVRRSNPSLTHHFTMFSMGTIVQSYNLDKMENTVMEIDDWMEWVAVRDDLLHYTVNKYPKLLDMKLDTTLICRNTEEDMRTIYMVVPTYDGTAGLSVTCSIRYRTQEICVDSWVSCIPSDDPHWRWKEDFSIGLLRQPKEAVLRSTTGLLFMVSGWFDTKESLVAFLDRYDMILDNDPKIQTYHRRMGELGYANMQAELEQHLRPVKNVTNDN